MTVLVQKGDPYTFFRRIPIHAAQGATLADPTLAGIVLRSTRPTVMPGILYRLFSARAKLDRHRQVDGFAGAGEIVVRSVDGRPVPLHVDASDSDGHASTPEPTASTANRRRRRYRGWSLASGRRR